jgi:hypothetical protein
MSNKTAASSASVGMDTEKSYALDEADKNAADDELDCFDGIDNEWEKGIVL